MVTGVQEVLRWDVRQQLAAGDRPDETWVEGGRKNGKKGDGTSGEAGDIDWIDNVWVSFSCPLLIFLLLFEYLILISSRLAGDDTAAARKDAPYGGGVVGKEAKEDAAVGR